MGSPETVYGGRVSPEKNNVVIVRHPKNKIKTSVDNESTV